MRKTPRFSEKRDYFSERNSEKEKTVLSRSNRVPTASINIAFPDRHKDRYPPNSPKLDFGASDIENARNAYIDRIKKRKEKTRSSFDDIHNKIFPPLPNCNNTLQGEGSSGAYEKEIDILLESMKMEVKTQGI